MFCGIVIIASARFPYRLARGSRRTELYVPQQQRYHRAINNSCWIHRYIYDTNFLSLYQYINVHIHRIDCLDGENTTAVSPYDISRIHGRVLFSFYSRHPAAVRQETRDVTHADRAQPHTYPYKADAFMDHPPPFLPPELLATQESKQSQLSRHLQQ